MNPVAALWGSSLGLYGLSNVFFLGALGLRRKFFDFFANAFILAGMIAQLLALVLIGVQFKMFPILNLHDALGFFAVLIALAYLVALLKWPLSSLGFFAVSLAFLSTLASYAFPSSLPQATGELSGLILEVHIFIIILSFGVLALAFCASVVYLLQDALLRRKHNIPFLRRLPSLSMLDSLINRFVGFGFILLSIGMFLGIMWADRWWGTWWSFDPKQDLALLTWIVYAIYIHARALGWKGKGLVIFIIFAFLLVVLTFLATGLLPGRHKFV